MSDIVDVYNGCDYLLQEIEYLRSMNADETKMADLIDALSTCESLERAQVIVGEFTAHEFIDRLRFKMRQNVDEYINRYYCSAMKPKEKYMLWLYDYNLRHKEKLQSLYL